MTAFIASVRLKSSGEVFYRIKGQLKSWTEDRSKASHFPTRDEAERSMRHLNPERYDKFVGTAREVSDQMSGVKYVAAVRGKETGKVRYRVAPTYPHLGADPVWSEKIADAHRFDTVEAAEKVISLMSNASYEKKVGTPSQVQFWASQRVDMEKLQDSVNESVKKIAHFALAPTLYVNLDGEGSPATSVSNVKRDVPDVVEAYAEHAERIYENRTAGDFTWVGFLNEFLREVARVAK